MRLMKFNKWFLILSWLLLSFILKGQDPVFSQFYLAPTQLNPAFVGNNIGPNFYLNYRNQWPSINQAYVTYAASYDQFFENANSGIGLVLVADDAGNGLLQNNKAMLQYSYRLRVNRKLFVKAGLEVGALQTRLAWDQLVFFDQLDPQFGANTPGGGIIPTSETPPDQTSLYNFDLGFGVAVYSKEFYGGISLKHLNTPQLTFFEDADNLSGGLPMRMVLHAGWQISPAGDQYRPGDPMLSPNIIFVNQGTFRQINLGLHGGLGPVFGGIAYRHAWTNPDAIILSIGFRSGLVRFGYSYDITVSSLSVNSGGAHELGLNFILNYDKPVNYDDCFGLFR